MAEPLAKKTFAIGDRVRITRPDHLWTGHTGLISAPMTARGFDWVVDLEDARGLKAGCRESDLVAVRRG